MSPVAASSPSASTPHAASRSSSNVATSAASPGATRRNVTPAGASFGDPLRQRAGIERNNAALQSLAEARGIAFVDTFDVSRGAAGDRSLVARDGLHPSGAQYARWVDLIAPVVSGLLDA